MLRKLWKRLWCLHVYEPSYSEKLGNHMYVGYPCLRCIYCEKIKI